MTARKHLKARVRERMAHTGESYVTARRHVVASAEPAPVTDHGYALRGGLHPETAAIANVLAHHGAPLSEAMVLGVGGGLGAGYILWEFKAHGVRTVVLGFRNRWQYPDRWTRAALERLGVPYEMHETGGARTAEAQLDGALERGRPALAWIDRETVGYWHLPPFMSGRGGYPVVAYAAAGDRIRVDDRNLAPLTVDRETFAAARARVGSYKHRLVVCEPRAPLTADEQRAAVRAGLADAAEHLAARSDSFGLPAWGKWGRTLTDERAAKGWPKVFADCRGLTGALLSTYEGILPVGFYGGHLRDLYADFLDEAAPLLDAPQAATAAAAWRAATELWRGLADAVLPPGVGPFAALRDRLAAVHTSVVAEGDAGAEAAAAAAAELWALRAELDSRPPLSDDQISDLLRDAGDRLGSIYEAETEAAARSAELAAGR